MHPQNKQPEPRRCKDVVWSGLKSKSVSSSTLHDFLRCFPLDASSTASSCGSSKIKSDNNVASISQGLTVASTLPTPTNALCCRAITLGVIIFREIATNVHCETHEMPVIALNVLLQHCWHKMHFAENIGSAVFLHKQLDGNRFETSCTR